MESVSGRWLHHRHETRRLLRRHLPFAHLFLGDSSVLKEKSIDLQTREKIGFPLSVREMLMHHRLRFCFQVNGGGVLSSDGAEAVFRRCQKDKRQHSFEEKSKMDCTRIMIEKTDLLLSANCSEKGRHPQHSCECFLSSPTRIVREDHFV
jgi:hypothetical protein